MASTASPLVSRGRMLQQVLPQAPPTYDQIFLNQLVDAVNNFMSQSAAPGDVTGARFIWQDFPVVDPSQPQWAYPDTSKFPTGMMYLAVAPPPPTADARAANPPSTSSTSWVMMGLGAQFTATPTAGTAIFTIDGNIGNTGNGDTDLQLVYGTGPPPTYGAPLTGTPLGEIVQVTGTGGGGVVPFSRTGMLTGLTPGVTYWIDAAVRVTSGTSILQYVELTGHGLQSAPQYYVTVLLPPNTFIGTGYLRLNPDPPIAHSATARRPSLQAGDWGLSGGSQEK